MRLIDADALKEMLGGVRAYYNCFDEDEKKFYEAYSKAIEILNVYLDKEPTVDAVEVVRCRECKYNINNALAYNDDDTVACFGWCELFMTHYGEDAYCSFGKRAER